MKDWLIPDWPAPSHVRAFVTTRSGGVSEGEYASMNLGKSSGDDPAKVERNRAIVRGMLPSEPMWLAQVHGVDVARADEAGGVTPRADASVSFRRGVVGVVLTADCMPVFLSDRKGTRVGVAHAGWRGLSAGVLENTIKALDAPPSDLIAWMGPAIGPDAFEVGPEVREAFLAQDAASDSAFRAHKPGKYMADLYALARQRLSRAGLRSVHGGGFCTYRDTDRFFSYRRVQKSGRMGAFIWME